MSQGFDNKSAAAHQSFRTRLKTNRSGRHQVYSTKFSSALSRYQSSQSGKNEETSTDRYLSNCDSRRYRWSTLGGKTWKIMGLASNRG
jgi:hypothetical protein